MTQVFRKLHIITDKDGHGESTKAEQFAFCAGCEVIALEPRWQYKLAMLADRGSILIDTLR